MTDPLSLFSLSAIINGLWAITTTLTKTLAPEVIGGRLDSLTYDKWKKLTENLKLYRPDANHDLHKAIGRSYLQATLQICAMRLETIGENTDSWFRRELLPGFLSKPLKRFQRPKFVTLDLHSEKALLKAVSLDLLREIKTLEEQKELLPTEDDNRKLASLLGEYELLLRPESGAEREAALREHLIEQVYSDFRKKYGDFTPAFKQLLDERWFDLLCACFQYYLKQNQQVANIFMSKMLAEQAITFADVEKSLEAMGGEMVKRLEQAHVWLPREMQQGFERIEDMLQSSLRPLLAMAREDGTRIEMLLIVVRDEVKAESQRVIDELTLDAESRNETLLEQLRAMEAKLDKALKADASIPRQLRPQPRHWVGRVKEMKELLEAVREKGVLISGLQGMGGIGKTALALKLSHEIKGDYADGQIFIDLKGVIPRDDSGIKQEPVSQSEVMRHVVNSFLPEIRMPDSLDEQMGLYASVLADKRVLLLFDNARDAKQLNGIIPPESCLLIITSRKHFLLDGMFDKNLEKLTIEESRELLIEIEPRIGEWAGELAGICDCLPIALRAVASALANTRSLTPEKLAERLQDKKKLLRMEDESRSVAVEAAFSLSYELLDDELARRWRTLAVFPDSFFTDAAAAVWEAEENEAEEELEEIYRYSLLEWNDETKRYRLHDLAREFAGAKMSDEERGTAERLHAVHYQRVIARADDLYMQGHDGVATGLGLFDLERANIQAGRSWAASQGEQDEEAARLCIDYLDGGAYVLYIRQHPREYIRWQETALSAARLLKDKRSEGIALGNLGNAYKDLGEARKAIEHYEQALVVSREIGDRRNEGTWLGNLGIAYKNLGEVRKAIEYYEQALIISREIIDRRSEGDDLGNLGNAYSALGEVRRAMEYYEQALAISREIGDRLGEGNTLGNLGTTYKSLGEVRKAIEYYEQALIIAREIGDLRHECVWLGSLGNAYRSLREVRKAIEYYEQALIISREIGDRSGEGNHLGNLGIAYSDLGEVRKAIELMEASLKIFEEIESPNANIARQNLEKLRGE